MKGALSYFECVARIATEITLGAVVMSPTRSVGRYACANDAAGELRFACLTLQGSLVESPEFEEHALSFWEKSTETRQDWTAFGAAKAFVDEVGTGGAQRALRKLEADRAKSTPAGAPTHRTAFVWTVQETDRDGRPTLRTCRLDRIRWPGLAVWHERGVYELMTVDRRGTSFRTGFVFKSQRDLLVHLESIRVTRASGERDHSGSNREVS